MTSNGLNESLTAFRNIHRAPKDASSRIIRKKRNVTLRRWILGLIVFTAIFLPLAYRLRPAQIHGPYCQAPAVTVPYNRGYQQVVLQLTGHIDPQLEDYVQKQYPGPLQEGEVISPQMPCSSLKK